MKRVAKHKRSAGLGRRRAAVRAAKRCLRALTANLGLFDKLYMLLFLLKQLADNLYELPRAQT